MNKKHFDIHPGGWRPSGVRLMQAAVLALMVALALPARAEERAVKARVAAVYPEIAKRMRISGDVKLTVTVNADGKVTDAKATSGNHMLSAAAEDAVKKWKFEPGAGATTEEVTISFAMGQ
jgi:TonB family protein